MVRCQKFVVGKLFYGEIEEDDLEFVEEELPSVEDGEYLVEALFLSVDPYMRAYVRSYTIGQVMIGLQVGRVIESRNLDFPVGTLVVGSFGWRTHTIVSKESHYQVYRAPDLEGLPSSLAVGVLGMPGTTAYFGLLDICKPQKGETVVVTGAAGAVGNHVGQIALIKGCTVIGIAGSKQKCDWLKLLGFHHVINYKNVDNLDQELKKCAPKGVDCYFDNVGGEISSTIISQMNLFGRIAVCGSISSYDTITPPKATIIQPSIVAKQLEMKGFIVSRYADRAPEAIQQNLEWILNGKLKYREHITDGFKNSPRALMGVMKGENIGKAVVWITGPQVEQTSLDFKSARAHFQNLL